MKLRGALFSTGWLLGGAAVLLAAATPTPTPRPRLSGGFGRPRTTPVPVAVSEGGQGLSDVVRAAQETGEKEKSGITIDNRNLVKDSAKGRLTTSSVAASSPAKPPAPSPTSASATAAPGATASTGGNGAHADASAPEAGGEAEWRDITRRDRKAVDDARKKVDELTATSRKLENDFYAWDDGQYRDRVIKPAWDRAKADLEQARVELDTAEKQLADLPERARKAGALPGWIRE